MADYNYTDGDGVTVLDATTPDGATEPVSVLDDAIRQIKAYLKDATKGPQALIDALAASEVGVIKMYAGSSVPTGYLLCDGSAVSRTTYSALFAAIGVTYGVGDGTTTFNLPDLAGRSAIGVGTTVGATEAVTVTLGQKLGNAGVEMTEDMLVPHTHSVLTRGALNGTAGANPIWANDVSTTTGSAGTGNELIPTIQPSLGVHFIIKT